MPPRAAAAVVCCSAVFFLVVLVLTASGQLLHDSWAATTAVGEFSTLYSLFDAPVVWESVGPFVRGPRFINASGDDYLDIVSCDAFYDYDVAQYRVAIFFQRQNRTAALASDTVDDGTRWEKTRRVLYNTTTVFEAPSSNPWPQPADCFVAVADVTGDGIDDILMPGGYLAGLGGGQFAASPVNITVAGDYDAVTAADVDGDGDIDVIGYGGGIANRIYGAYDTTLLPGMFLLRNDGAGGFGFAGGGSTANRQWLNTTAAETVYSLVVGDVTRDGIADIVIAGSDGVKYLAGQGGGGGGSVTFSGALRQALLPSAVEGALSSQSLRAAVVRLADFDHEGGIDAVVTASTHMPEYAVSNAVYVCRAVAGDAAVAATGGGSPYAAAGRCILVQAGQSQYGRALMAQPLDLDQDGWLDLAIRSETARYDGYRAFRYPSTLQWIRNRRPGFAEDTTTICLHCMPQVLIFLGYQPFHGLFSDAAVVDRRPGSGAAVAMLGASNEFFSNDVYTIFPRLASLSMEATTLTPPTPGGRAVIRVTLRNTQRLPVLMPGVFIAVDPVDVTEGATTFSNVTSNCTIGDGSSDDANCGLYTDLVSVRATPTLLAGDSMVLDVGYDVSPQITAASLTWRVSTYSAGGNCELLGGQQSNDLAQAVDYCGGQSAVGKLAPGICGCQALDNVTNLNDTDADGTIDCLDVCPTDPAKATSAGICGCSKVDNTTDTDGDGTPDCVDLCPRDPRKVAPGQCGCGVASCNSNTALSKAGIGGVTAAVVVAAVVACAVCLLLCAGLIALLVATRRARKEEAFVKLSQNQAVYLEDVTVLDDRKLGEGAFGAVCEGRWQGAAVALKRANGEAADALEKEAALFRSLLHPNVVQFLGLYRRPLETAGGSEATTMSNEELFVVSELVDGGNLLKLAKAGELTVPQVVRLAAGVAAGMTQLEMKRMVHRDLAARNVLVATKRGGEFIPKITDFGLSAKLPDGADKIVIHGPKPIRWTAPEALSGDEFSVKSDVWSFGVTIWEAMESGQMPYPLLMSNKEVAAFVQSGGRLKFTQPGKWPTELRTLLMACWSVDPRERPSFAEISATLSRLAV